MSEPSSLYARLTLSPADYEACLASAPAPPHAFADWQAWFDTKKMYGDGKVDERDLSAGTEATVGQLLAAIVGSAWSAATSEYDEESGIWRVAVLQLTENYREMIPVLAPLRGAARFTRSTSDDFVLVFPYLWGDPGCNAYLVFRDGESRFVEEPPDAHRSEAVEYLGKAIARMQGSRDL